MRILLIEDDEYKAKQILDFLKSSVNILDNQVVLKKAFQSGMESIVNNSYDLILLDMSMPTFEVSASRPSGRPRPYGGRDILYEMKRKEIKVTTIVITQYNVFGEGVDRLNITQLDESLKEKFSDMYLGLIYYSVSAIDWKELLLQLIHSQMEVK